LMKMLLDLHFVFMDFLLWSCLEFCCHVYLDDVYASDKDRANRRHGYIYLPLIQYNSFQPHVILPKLQPNVKDLS
jgi:hypothetical protein